MALTSTLLFTLKFNLMNQVNSVVVSENELLMKILLSSQLFHPLSGILRAIQNCYALSDVLLKFRFYLPFSPPSHTLALSEREGGSDDSRDWHRCVCEYSSSRKV